MSSRLVSLQAAVNMVKNGSTLAISGNMDMSPMSLIREVIRAGKRELSLVCVGAAAINADMLIGSGAVRCLEFSQVTLGEYGFAHNFRRRFENGSLEGLEHACPSLASAVQAGAMGIPFIPVRGLIGTDYMRIRPDFRVISNPYDEQEQLVIVPAIRPDMALFHAYQADTEGNVVAHPSQNNRILAQASKQTIVSVEEIVSPDELRKAGGSIIPSVFISAIVHAPLGAHPTGCPGRYGIDSGHVRTYMEASKSEAGFAGYLNRFVSEDQSEEEYLKAVSVREASQ
jgi:glutaconate CoA-transferase subunit A